MKNTVIKLLICCLTLSLFPEFAHAQFDELKGQIKNKLENKSAQDIGAIKNNFVQQMQIEEIKIDRFITEKMKSPIPQCFNQSTTQEHHNDKEKLSPQQELESKKLAQRSYYRNQYFKEYPDAIAKYNPGKTNFNSKMNKGSSAKIPPVCVNGDFENGSAALVSYLGYAGSINSNSECSIIPTTHTTYPNVGFSNVNNFMITNNVADPLVTSLKQTNNGSSHAIRINAPTPCAANQGINMLQKTFTTTTNGAQSISFSYALVLENPNHDGNPFFVARILDNNGIEQDRICRVLDTADPFFSTLNGASANGCNYDQLLYSNWTCDSLNFVGNTNQTYTVEFFVADCNAGAHFGYAYIDDICVNCLPPDPCNYPGYIYLLPTDTCQKNMTVCASYTPPILRCVTGIIQSPPTLTVLQGGIPTGLVIAGGVVDTIAQTICFTVSPADFGALTGRFDFKISASFAVGGTNVILDDANTNSGQDNDYTTVPCPPCGCGTWNAVNMFELPSSLGPTNCGKSIAHVFEVGKLYLFEYKYNCTLGSNCKVTYTLQEDLDGVVTGIHGTGNSAGNFHVTFTPNKNDCGVKSIIVTPYCDGQACPPCTLFINVDGCDTCVAPKEQKMYCDPTTKKPVVEFCVKNVSMQPRSYYGITLPPGVSYTNLTSTNDATLIYTTLQGMLIFQTPNAIPVNGKACTIKLQIDGGITQGQNLCIYLKSYTYFSTNGWGQNCCENPIPFCLTIPDCTHDCADILDAEIFCRINGQRVLRYKIRNNFFSNIHSYASYTVNGTPTDNFFGQFTTPIMPGVPLGGTSSYIYHVIPNNIPAGSAYCFVNDVHMNFTQNGHPCDTFCTSDIACVQVPYCPIFPDNPSKRKGANTKSPGNNSNSNFTPKINFLIYPNPVDDIINIKSQSTAHRINSIIITDISGKVLLQESEESLTQHKVDISSLPPGLYLLKVNNERVVKIIKE